MTGYMLFSGTANREFGPERRFSRTYLRTHTLYLSGKRIYQGIFGNGGDKPLRD